MPYNFLSEIMESIEPPDSGAWRFGYVEPYGSTAMPTQISMEAHYVREDFRFQERREDKIHSYTSIKQQA